MLWYKVNVSLDTHVKKLLYSWFVTLCEVCETVRLYNLGSLADPINAALQITWVSEVVEGNRRIVINVGVDQVEVACGNGTGNLL